MSELQKMRLVLAATFALQIGGMITYWPHPEPEPQLPQPNYDLNILYDPPTTTPDQWCHPVRNILDQCPTVLR